MRKLFLFLSLILCFVAHAQRRTYPDTLQPKKLRNIIVGETVFYGAGMYYLAGIWYKDTPRVPFHYYNDNAGYLQIDKMGHAFGSYMESYVGYYWLRSAGVKRNKALIYGATLGLVLQTPIEVFDGLYEGWGFSWGDMIANASGSALIISQELLFNEQKIKYKFGYNRSVYAQNANGYLGKNFLNSLFYDYNGHTYWLTLGLDEIVGEHRFVPPWLSLAVGYSANGMYGEFENKTRYRGVDIPYSERYRQYLLSLDIDLSKIHSKNKTVNHLLSMMSIIKIPFPALEYSTAQGVRGYWMYF